MKYPLVKSVDVVKYDFKRLSPIGYSVKDSCSFSIGTVNYVMCTNIKDGGLILFSENSLGLTEVKKLFLGWTDMWAPCVIQENGKTYVFCSDTGGAVPFWQTQRIKYFELTATKTAVGLTTVQFDQTNKGRIDPEIVRINGLYYIFYVIMDWNNGEWWDVYCSQSTNLLGPYTNEQNISQMVETGIEEAPHIIGDELYWSIGDSYTDSHIRRGQIVYQNGAINVNEDLLYRIGAVNSPTCTHPDSRDGKLRATLRDGNDFYIAEKI